MPERQHPVVVFDLGGVLVDWDPRHLYRKLINDDQAMEAFLEDVCNGAWNVWQDAGRPFADAVELMSARHPGHRDWIEAYWKRWPEMLGGPIQGTVTLLETLKAEGVELHALTNWSAETFPVARERYGFLGHFGTTVVSGEVGLVKPDRRIFDLLLERIGHPGSACLYIDDSPVNVVAAKGLGFDAIHFTDPMSLEAALAERGLPVPGVG